jgi:hypothetical protein
MAYAAAVCLEERGHQTGIPIHVTVDGSTVQRLPLYWPAASPEAQRSWADPDEATEQGACAIAALLVDTLTDLTILERSRTHSGFDYWLGPRNHPTPLFQDKTRLEVSGIRHAEEDRVRARERQKFAQITRNESSQTRRLPCIVVIVEFGMPQSRFTAR